jgi:hypothetical protein
MFKSMNQTIGFTGEPKAIPGQVLDTLLGTQVEIHLSVVPFGWHAAQLDRNLTPEDGLEYVAIGPEYVVEFRASSVEQVTAHFAPFQGRPLRHSIKLLGPFPRTYTRAAWEQYVKSGLDYKEYIAAQAERAEAA